MRKSAPHGFTLIELLIVVVIIGILATLAIPKFSGTKDRAYQAAMKSDLKNLTTQQEVYFDSKGRYAKFIVASAGTSTAGDSATVDTLGFRPSPNVGMTADTSQPRATFGWAWSATATHRLLGTGKNCIQSPDTTGVRAQMRCN